MRVFFLSEHEAACVAATLIQSHGEQSANRGLMTAPHRPAWPLNLPEAPPPRPPPQEGIYQLNVSTSILKRWEMKSCLMLLVSNICVYAK